MADKFLMVLQLKKQGVIVGSSTIAKGALASKRGMECLCFGLETSSRSGEKSCSAGGHGCSGKSARLLRNNKPFSITREVDMASPKLRQAWMENEPFTSAKLEFDSGGTAGFVQTIELTNGRVVGIQNAPPVDGKPCQKVTFVYEALKVNGAPGAIPVSVLGHWRGPWG